MTDHVENRRRSHRLCRRAGSSARSGRCSVASIRSHAAGSASAGRPPTQWGMMRLRTVGRRTGEERVAILGYFEDGQDLVTMAMNGWADAEPAWWLNLQAQPDVTVDLPGGSRAVHAHAANPDERPRLWAMQATYDKDLEAYAALTVSRDRGRDPVAPPRVEARTGPRGRTDCHEGRGERERQVRTLARRPDGPARRPAAGHGGVADRPRASTRLQPLPILAVRRRGGRPSFRVPRPRVDRKVPSRPQLRHPARGARATGMDAPVASAA